MRRKGRFWPLMPYAPTALDRAGMEGGEVQDFTLGCALTQGTSGINVARHAILRCRSSMSCAHRYHRPAMRIRPVCHRDGRKPKSGPATTVMLAEVHGRIAGICLYFPMYSSWLGESGLYIQDLFVNEEFRSARIGEKLLRQFGLFKRKRVSTCGLPLLGSAFRAETGANLRALITMLLPTNSGQKA